VSINTDYNSKLDAAFDQLCLDVAKGMEYPDAEMYASRKFNVESQDLADLYDNL